MRKRKFAAAIHKATGGRKRVLVVFGGNWCYDCHVLEEAFHSPEISPTMAKSFEVVHVDIGPDGQEPGHCENSMMCRSTEASPQSRYWKATGSWLFSQKRGEFEAARSMAPEDILDFLISGDQARPRN